MGERAVWVAYLVSIFCRMSQRGHRRTVWKSFGDR